jgi:hypothetical protein
MKHLAMIAAGIVLLCAAIVSDARATQIVYRSPQQLGQESALVVSGTVASVESYWNDTHTKVFTKTRIAVDETFKGTSQRMIDIIQLGGTVGTVKVTVHGALQWTPGEEVLLFVEPNDAATYRVAGFSQGKFEIERDPVTGAKFISRPALEGVQVLGAPSQQQLKKVSHMKKVTLEQFVSQALERR